MLLDTANKQTPGYRNKKKPTGTVEIKLLQDNHAGFRKDRGTTDNIPVLNYAILEELS